MRVGQRRWQPPVSEYREGNSKQPLISEAEHLMSTRLPEMEEPLLTAAHDVETMGRCAGWMGE